ncbi:MAG: hypothetical protein K5760_00070, partial [Clostridium sp.]|nr:hypothetical protein [Clostridium sp.]
MKKQVLAGVMAAAMTAALAACGSSAGSKTTTAAAESKAAETTAAAESKEAAAAGSGKTVKIICPYGVGGTADIIGRKYAEVATKLHPEYNFIVEQQTGGD